MLDALEAVSRKRIEPYLEPIAFKLSAVVCEAGGLLKHAYFPQGSVLSLLTVLENGSAIETANIVLMKSDPADILAAIRLSKATVVKMKQNLFWAVFYNVLAIPIAAGVFYPAFGWSLRPEISALLMSASSIIVALNAVSLKRIQSKL